jgi:hypothetical protein
MTPPRAALTDKVRPSLKENCLKHAITSAKADNCWLSLRCHRRFL